MTAKKTEAFASVFSIIHFYCEEQSRSGAYENCTKYNHNNSSVSYYGFIIPDIVSYKQDFNQNSGFMLSSDSHAYAFTFSVTTKLSAGATRVSPAAII